MTNLIVGSAIAEPGTKATGFIEVPAATDPGATIPVTVVCGATDGPVLALVAGTHGSEPAPILALQRIAAELDPLRLKGAVIIVQIANLPSFVHRTIYRGPWDQKNLNRMFPGDPGGTASERIAHAITTEVIDRCDYLIDMHAGDGNEDLRPYSYWNHSGADERVDAAARDLAIAFGIDHIVIDRKRPRDLRATLFLSNTAHVRGKPAVTTEAGGLGVPTPRTVEINVRGAKNVLRHLGMIAGKPVRARTPVWLEPSQIVTSPATGLWYPAVRSSQKVRKGARLGHLTDYFGVTTTVVRSPLPGVVLYVVASPAMTQGEPIAFVASLKRKTRVVT